MDDSETQLANSRGHNNLGAPDGSPGHRTVAWVDLTLLKSNLEKIAAFARRRYQRFDGAVAMVKCNAYGHGLIQAARALDTVNDTLALGVATFEEAVILRKNGCRKKIWVFSDAAGWPADAALGSIWVNYGFTPILHSLDDLKRLVQNKRQGLGSIPDFHLKFNTGMNRMGIDWDQADKVRRMLLSVGLCPAGICSHLASAENPRSRVTRVQVKRFEEIVSKFSSFNTSYIHCANTAGIFSEDYLQLGRFCNVIRPGIGIYGYRSGGEIQKNQPKLTPALQWQAQVLGSRMLKRGEVVGYGGAYRASSGRPQATIGVGYGDGLMRVLSNRNLLIYSGNRCHRVRIQGRVSMDLTSLELRARQGQWLTLLGESARQGATMAEEAGTIVYEILTGISMRVPRVYV